MHFCIELLKKMQKVINVGCGRFAQGPFSTALISDQRLFQETERIGCEDGAAVNIRRASFAI